MISDILIYKYLYTNVWVYKYIYKYDMCMFIWFYVGFNVCF